MDPFILMFIEAARDLAKEHNATLFFRTDDGELMRQQILEQTIKENDYDEYMKLIADSVSKNN